LLEKPDAHLETPPVRRLVTGGREHEKFHGRLGFDTRQIGNAVIELGGGRTRPQDPVDHAVGIVAIAGRDWDGSAPICEILARDEATADLAEQRILSAMKLAGKALPAIHERISVT
jgi:thymidine phosphorylase